MAEITIASYNKAVSPAFTGATATLKIWYDRQFLTSDDEIVLAGSVEYPNLEVACTVSGGGFTVTIPQFVIDSTIDGVPPNSRATAVLFDADGIHRETVLANFRIPDVPVTTTWPALFIYNQGGLVTLPDEYYTKNEVNALLNVISVGGASVTSTELSAAAAGLSIRVDSVANAVSVISQAVSALSADHLSLQNRVSANSALASNLQSAIQANSAQMTSADNTISNAVSIVSQAVSVEIVNRISADNALSVRINTASNAVSIVSQALSVEIANRISADQALSVGYGDAIANISVGALKGVSIASLTDQQALVWKSVAGQWVNSTIAAGVGSVTSTEVSAVSAAAASAAASLSVRIDTQSQSISVLSQALSALSQNLSANSVVLSNTRSAVIANSAQMTSADNALSVRIDTVSNAVSAKTISSLIGVSIASPTDQQVLVWNSVAAQWINSTVAAGAGSVTSTELSAVSAAAASAAASLSVRIDTQSQSISVLSQQLSALSQNLSANSVVLSNTRSAVQANSAQMTSADNAISNAVSIVSQAVSVEIVNRISADNALSVRIDTQSQSISVISQALSALSQNLSANSVVLSNTRSAVQANSAQMTSADNAISNAVSVVSAAVAVVSALVSTVASALSARIDTVSNALSAKKLTSLADVSGTPADGQVPQWNSAAAKFQFSTVAAGTGSVTSDEMSVAIAVETSNRISADNALSVRVNTVSQAVSALVLDALLNVSAPSPTDQQALIWNSAQAQWIASTVVGGSGSVTSTELSAASAAAASADATLSTRIDSAINAISVVSNAVSIELSNRISADNALSVRIDTQSQSISVLSQQVSVLSVRVASNSAQMVSADNAISAAVVTNSAQMTSANNAISNAVSIVSVATANALSAISVLSQQVSVLSARVASNSAQMVSADNAISNAVSIVSQALSVTNATLSNLASSHSVLSQQVSVLSAYVNRAIGTEFDAGIASTASVVVDWSNGRAQKFSIVANTPFAAPTNMSAGGRYILRIVQDATGNRQPTWNATYVWPNSAIPTLGTASAVDILGFYCDGTNLYGSYNDQLSAFQAAANTISNNISVIGATASVLSIQMSNLQSAANALSNQISATGSFTQAVLSGGVFTVSATALTNISGLSLSVSANSLYRITGELMYTFSGASSQNAGFGLTFPGMKQAGGRITMFNLGQPATASATRTGAWTGAGSGSNIVSGFTANTSGVEYYGEIRGLFNVSTTGVIQVQAKATSAGAGAIHMLQGSNIKLFKIGG